MYGKKYIFGTKSFFSPVGQKKKIHNLQILLKWFFHITELEYKEGQKNCALYRKDKLNDLRPFAEVW